MKEYTELKWDEIEDGEWAACGTVYSASEDWDPFKFRISENDGAYNLAKTDAELLPPSIMRKHPIAMIGIAKCLCEIYNRAAWESERHNQ